MLLPDIIKPMNGRKIQGMVDCADADTLSVLNTNRYASLTRSCILLMLLLLVFLLRRPNQVAEKVAARISENFSEAAIVMVKSVHNTYTHADHILCWNEIVMS